MLCFNNRNNKRDYKIFLFGHPDVTWKTTDREKSTRPSVRIIEKKIGRNSESVLLLIFGYFHKLDYVG